MVVETMQQEHLGYLETARRFELKGFHGIQRWERIYLEEGPQGLYEERRGRGSKGRPRRQMAPKAEEDLLAEVQRLRAENDYLKKLNALVLEEERQSKRRK